MKPSIDWSIYQEEGSAVQVVRFFTCLIVTVYTVACSSFDTNSSGCGNVHDRKTTGKPISNDAAILLAT